MTAVSGVCLYRWGEGSIGFVWSTHTFAALIDERLKKKKKNTHIQNTLIHTQLILQLSETKACSFQENTLNVWIKEAAAGGGSGFIPPNI